MDFIKINGVVIIPSIDYGRHCVRCGAGVHGRYESQPHLCKDVTARLREAEAQAWAEYAREMVVHGGES